VRAQSSKVGRLRLGDRCSRISRGTPEARSRLCVCRASFLMTFAMGGGPHAGPQQHTSSPVAPIAFPVTVSFVVWVLFTGLPVVWFCLCCLCFWCHIQRNLVHTHVTTFPLCPRLVLSWFQALCLSLCCVLR